MKFSPKSEQEIQALGLIAPGVYSFEVVEANDKISKKGSEMIELKLKIWYINGAERVVFDYLLEAMSYKLRHFAECTGILDKYNAGHVMADDCLHLCGKVELIIQDGQPKPEGGYYPSKNSVKDYVKIEGEAVTIASASTEGDFQDDIPF